MLHVHVQPTTRIWLGPSFNTPECWCPAQVGKSYTALVAKAKSKKEVLATVDEGIAKVVSVYNKGAKAVDDLKDMVKALRRLPVVDPVLPTVLHPSS